jgi:tetratricopeptide (TPR) repeat protein
MDARRLRVPGIVIALSSGLLVCYFGYKLGYSYGPRDPVARSGATVQPQAPDSHERMFLAEALKKKPNHTPVLFRLAQISEKSGKHSEAAARLREILRFEPGNTDARLELGRVLFQTGDVQGAIEQTKWILDRHPDHADALYNLGAIYANLGNADHARRFWGRLLEAKPQSESAQRARTMLTQLSTASRPAVEDFNKRPH